MTPEQVATNVAAHCKYRFQFGFGNSMAWCINRPIQTDSPNETPKPTALTVIFSAQKLKTTALTSKLTLK
jgi:hypothetical protein